MEELLPPTTFFMLAATTFFAFPPRTIVLVTPGHRDDKSKAKRLRLFNMDYTVSLNIDKKGGEESFFHLALTAFH